MQYVITIIYIIKEGTNKVYILGTRMMYKGLYR